MDPSREPTGRLTPSSVEAPQRLRTGQRGAAEAINGQCSSAPVRVAVGPWVTRRALCPSCGCAVDVGESEGMR